MSDSPGPDIPGSRLQRLGKNVNGYLGETLDIDSVQRDCLAAAQAHGWKVEEIHPAPRLILGFTRDASRVTQHAASIYISTGMHGDEPAGPLAARRLLQENAWPECLTLWFCPCLNPTGFPLNRRENREGIDLNRHYRAPKAAETLAHIGWLQRQPSFDLCLCLHEDWEARGFYTYEQNPDNQPSLAGAIIDSVAQVCPVDRSPVIEGFPANQGVVHPNLDPRTRVEWPEAFFLITHKTRLSYTLEAPSDFPLAARVAALTAGVNAALSTIARRRRNA